MLKNERRLSLALTSSIALHAAAAAALLFFKFESPMKTVQTQTPVEVELMEPAQLLEQFKKAKPVEEKTKGQIVEQNEKRLNDETPDDARFLSRNNQKVIRETQSALRGKFTNSADQGGAESEDQRAGKEATELDKTDRPVEQQATNKSPKKDEPKTETLTSNDGVGAVRAKPSIKDLTPSFKPTAPRIESETIASGGGIGPSAHDDRIKDVATGMQTLLSTREFVYYSYYNRIKDRLRQHWEPKIKEKMTRIVRQGRNIASDTDRITKIVIVLNEQGILVGVQVVGASGVRDLDDAAIEAFRAAAPFPNPPKGIIESDGTVKIRWDFILEANHGVLKSVKFASSN